MNSVKILEKTVHFRNMDLAGVSVRRGIARYQKQQFVHVLLNSCSQKLRKIYSNEPAPESFFNLQPATPLKKRRRIHFFYREFCEMLFRKNTCELVLKGEFYGLTGSKVDSNSNFQLISFLKDFTNIFCYPLLCSGK